MTKEQIFDEWLILQYQSGNKKSINILAKRWYTKILRKAYWHTKDMEISKDIAQEAWIAIIKGINKIKEPAKFGSWVSQIVYAKSVDWIRSQQKERHNQEVRLEVQEGFGTDKSEAEETLIQGLRQHIKALPDKQRIVLSMFYLDNHSLQEISEVLKISKGTIKSRLFHAREKLKQILKLNYYEK